MGCDLLIIMAGRICWAGRDSGPACFYGLQHSEVSRMVGQQILSYSRDPSSTMNHYAFHNNQPDNCKQPNPHHKNSFDMVRSMIAEGANIQNSAPPSRIPRLSQFLPQDPVPEEQTLLTYRMMQNKPMILTSRKNRKYSEAVFNKELMQNMNHSKFFETKIVEPLKFGDKDKVKSPKVQQQINKTSYEKFECALHSPQSDPTFNNRSHLAFNPSRFEKNQLTSPKLLNFRTSPKTDPDKQDSSPKRIGLEYANIHAKEPVRNPEEKGYPNLVKYKTPPLMKASTFDSFAFKEKQPSDHLAAYLEAPPPLISTQPQNYPLKKAQTFSSSNVTSFFKKFSGDERVETITPFKKSKQIKQIKETDTKDGSNSDLTPTESLRSSINRLSKEDFYFGKRLGKGKFGEVFLAKHKEIGFLCAMKIIPKKVVQSEKIQNQLCSEIKIQLYLSHPNIVSLYGIFSDKQNIYLLLEPCLDGQLYHHIKKHKRITEKQTASVVRQICIAVDYLHSEKIIHRDIKPQNVLLNEGVIKICDFGWAAFHNDQFRDTFCGTPLYLSPELLNQNTYDDKVDNWAIGILTYEMLFGRIPFKISTKQQLQKILFEEIVFPEFIEVSEHAKKFILMMLQRNPEKRAQLQACLCHPFFTAS